MENKNNKNDFLEKMKKNALHIISITLSVVAIILSVVSLNGNARHMGHKPREERFAYERQMDGRNFNKAPGRESSQRFENEQGPRNFEESKGPGYVGRNPQIQGRQQKSLQEDKQSNNK